MYNNCDHKFMYMNVANRAKNEICICIKCMSCSVHIRKVRILRLLVTNYVCKPVEDTSGLFTFVLYLIFIANLALSSTAPDEFAAKFLWSVCYVTMVTTEIVTVMAE